MDTTNKTKRKEKQLRYGHPCRLRHGGRRGETLHMWTQIVGKVRLELSPHVEPLVAGSASTLQRVD